MNCACGWDSCWGEAECGTPQNNAIGLALLLSGGSLESLLLDCVEEDEEV